MGRMDQKETQLALKNRRKMIFFTSFCADISDQSKQTWLTWVAADRRSLHSSGSLASLYPTS